MARRLGPAPLYQYFDQKPTNDWLETITERMNFYRSGAAPTIGEVPNNQWILHYNTATATLALYANNNGTLVWTTLTTGGGGGDVVGPAFAVNNRVVFFDGATGKLIKDSGLTLSGTNTGDQTSISGITGTKAQYNVSLTDGDFVFTDMIGTNVQAWDADLDAIAALATTGFAARTAGNTWALRTITGTANEITVTFGTGVGGDPTISLPAALTFTGKTVTGGTFNGGTISAANLGVNNQHASGFDFRIAYNSALTANRSLTVALNDVSRGINMSGNLVVSAAADVSGTNTGDETLTSIGTKLDSAAAKNPLVDADVVITLDSAAGNAVKKWSFLNVKANLKSYFDTLYQVLDADLTSWAAVVRAVGFDTWAATPSSANLRSLVTDESGTGALLFQSGDLGTPTAGVMTNVTGTAASLTAGVANALLVANEAADTTCFIGFYTAASGNLPGKTNANLTFNSSTGVLTSASAVLTTADINGGTVDGSIIGGASAAAGTFTTLTATGQIVISGAGAGQIVFPATKNASANANTLDDYQEGSFTGTGTGFTTSPTCTIYYTIVGNSVTMDISGAGISATSNATTFTITGMPAEAFPASTKAVLVRTKNNGAAHIVSVATINSAGTITLFNGPDGAAFTNSGTKACPACSFAYTLA